MATTYWNFDTNKPTRNTNLKADWGLHEYAITYKTPISVSYVSGQPTKNKYTIDTPAWNMATTTFSSTGERGPANFLGWAFSHGVGVVGDKNLRIDPQAFKSSGQLGDKTIYALFDRYWIDIAFYNQTTGTFEWASSVALVIDIYINGSLVKKDHWGWDFFLGVNEVLEIKNIRVKDSTKYQYMGPSVIRVANLTWSRSVVVQYKEK